MSFIKKNISNLFKLQINLFLLIFFIIGCETKLPTYDLRPPLFPVDDLSVEQKNAYDISIEWNYISSESESQEGLEINSFRIYNYNSSQLVNPNYDDFNNFNNSITIDEVLVQSNQLNSKDYIYNWKNLDYNKYHYFYIAAIYINTNGELIESLDNEITDSLYLEIPKPTYLNDNNQDCAILGLDNDCFYPVFNNNYYELEEDSISMKISYYQDTDIVYEEIFSNIENLKLSNGQNTFGTGIGLSLCNDINTENINFQYCNLLPNEIYNIEISLYSTRDGFETRYSEPYYYNGLEWVRELPGEISFREFSNSSARIYFSSDISTEYFDNIYVKLDTQNNPNHFNINELNQINDKYFFNLDLNNVDSILISFNGSNSFINNRMEIKTLPIEMNDFVLIDVDLDCTGDLCVEDEFYYMTKHEITEETYISEDFENQKDGYIPIQISYNDVVSFIASINNNYNYLDYTFYLPTKYEWKYAACWDYNNKEEILYPFGNTISGYHANYLNSDYPVGLNDILVTGFFETTSVYGLKDQAGNLSEWVIDIDSELDSNDGILKGGSFLSNYNDLSCNSIVIEDKDYDIGTGFRLVTKKTD